MVWINRLLQVATCNHTFRIVYLWRESGFGGSTIFIQILIFTILVFDALDARDALIRIGLSTLRLVPLLVLNEFSL